MVIELCNKPDSLVWEHEYHIFEATLIHWWWVAISVQNPELNIVNMERERGRGSAPAKLLQRQDY